MGSFVKSLTAIIYYNWETMKHMLRGFKCTDITGDNIRMDNSYLTFIPYYLLFIVFVICELFDD